MTALTDILIDMGAPGRGAPAALRWLSDWLLDADIITLTAADLARIDGYRGEAEDLHALLPSVLPLSHPVWYQAEVIAQRGTRMVMGYGAVPMDEGAIDIGWCCWAPVSGRIVGPLGPARVTVAGMDRPEGLSDESWRELRSATGVVLRALLLGIGAR